MKSQSFPLFPAAALLLIAFLVFFSACTLSLECGSWTFKDGKLSSAPAKFPVTSTFTFNPANCGKGCTCDKVAMIQMVSTYWAATKSRKFASSSYQARASAAGWSIDKVDGEGYGYYGLFNDGVTFTSYWNTPGSNGTPDILQDEPVQPHSDKYMFAVDAAVCFDSGTCKDKLLGYYYWSFYINDKETPSTYLVTPGWQDLETQLQDAIASWNKWAPASGPEAGVPPVPGHTATTDPPLPHAISLPALSDL